jgi:hypothetical protein
MAGVFGEPLASRPALCVGACDAPGDAPGPPVPGLGPLEAGGALAGAAGAGAGAGFAAGGGVTTLCTTCVTFGTAFNRPPTVSPTGSCPDPRLASGSTSSSTTAPPKAAAPIVDRAAALRLPSRDFINASRLDRMQAGALRTPAVR